MSSDKVMCRQALTYADKQAWKCKNNHECVLILEDETAKGLQEKILTNIGSEKYHTVGQTLYGNNGYMRDMVCFRLAMHCK